MSVGMDATQLNAETLKPKLGDVQALAGTGDWVLTSVMYLEACRLEVWTHVPAGESVETLGKTWRAASVCVKALASEHLL